MKNTLILLLILIAGLFGFSAAAQQDNQGDRATAELRDAEGNTVGNATFTTTDDGGVRIQVTLDGFDAASEGEHGIHIHQTGECEPDFQAAGGHFNPEGDQHGLLNREGPHAGDLPNIQVDENGNAEYEVTTRLVTLGEGENSLFDDDGSALVIHAGADDYVTDPSGDSGDRIACGVIGREGEGQEQEGQQQDQQDQDEQAEQQDEEQGQEEQQDDQQDQAASAQQEQQAQEGQGQLEISVEPADASVRVIGPNGFRREASDGETLENLDLGTYIIMATQVGYRAARERVDVAEGDTATVNLTLERTEQSEQQGNQQEEQQETESQEQQGQQQGEGQQEEQQSEQGEDQQQEDQQQDEQQQEGQQDDQQQDSEGDSEGDGGTGTAVDQEQLAEQGQEIFQNNCAVCHGAQGRGASGPALAGNDNLQDTEHVINMILHGGGGMPAFADRLSDEEIAAVATFIRTSWRNDFGPVNPEQVAEER